MSIYPLAGSAASQPRSVLRIDPKFGRAVSAWVPPLLADFGSANSLTASTRLSIANNARHGREFRFTGSQFTPALTWARRPGTSFECWLVVLGSSFSANGSDSFLGLTGNDVRVINTGQLRITAASSARITSTNNLQAGDAVFVVLRNGDYRMYHRGTLQTDSGAFGSPILEEALNQTNDSVSLLARWTDEIPPDAAIWELLDNPWRLFTDPAASFFAVDAGAGGATYEVAATETATASDTQASSVSAPVALTEAASGSDAIAAAIVAIAAAAEAGVAAEIVSIGAATFDANIAEAVSAADVIAAAAALIAARVEAAAAGDVYVATMLRPAASSEAATASDATNWGGAIYSADVAETATLADAVAAALQALVAVGESGAAADAVVAITLRPASAAESASAADLVAGNVPASIAAALSEAAFAGDVGVAFLDGAAYVPTDWSFSPPRFGTTFRVIAFGKTFRVIAFGKQFRPH